MDMNEVLEKVIQVVSEETGCKDITKDSKLVDDLELSSLESFVVLSELEETFDISLSEDLLLDMVTIEDVCNIVIDKVNNA